MAPSEPQDPRPRARTFRQSSATVSGIVIFTVCAIFAISAVPPFFDGTGGAGSVLLPLGVACLVWVVLLRPCVKLNAEGVELRNVVRNVLVSWSAVDLVEARWTLAVVTKEGREFKSFAISAQRPKRGQVPDAGVGTKVLGSFTPASPDHLDHRSGSAGAVAERLRSLIEQYDRGVKDGVVEQVEPRTEVRPAYLAIAVSVAAVALIVVSIVL